MAAWKDMVRVCGVGAGTVVATELTPILLDQGLNPLLSTIVAAIVSIGTYALAVLLLIKIPMRIPRLRPRLDPAARIEGHWIQELDGPLAAGGYTLVKVAYEPEDGSHSLEGTAVGPSWAIHANFASTHARFDPGTGRLLYRYNSQVSDQDPANVTGNGTMDFRQNLRGDDYVHGTGYFIDEGQTLQRRNVRFSRLPRDLPMLQAKRDIETPDDVIALLREYAARSGSAPRPAPSPADVPLRA